MKVHIFIPLIKPTSRRFYLLRNKSGKLRASESILKGSPCDETFCWLIIPLK